MATMAMRELNWPTSDQIYSASPRLRVLKQLGASGFESAFIRVDPR